MAAILDFGLEILIIRNKGLFKPNPAKPEITNNKHQITNKFQITISKSQIRSKTNCLGF